MESFFDSGEPLHPPQKLGHHGNNHEMAAVIAES
jgi:hypothetical protein